jgi:hypothetical protein
MAGENPQTTLPPVPREPMVDRAGQTSMQWTRWLQQVQRILSFAGGVAWGIINKAGSKLSDLAERTHAMLQEVLGWVSDEDTAQVRHISNADGKVWQDHVEITDGNPHGTDHDMLDGIAVLNPASADTVQDRHLSDAQGKHWQDHVDNDAQDDHSQYLLLAGRVGQTVTTPLIMGDATDNTTIEESGFIVHNGGASGWHDVEFPQAVPKATGAGNPTLATLIGGIKGYAYAIGDTNPFDPRETVHKSKLGSTATWHIHFTSMANDGTDRFIKWQLEYTPEPVSGAYTGTTTIDVEVTIPAGTAAKTPMRVNINTFTVDAIAVLMHCTLTRIAASGAAPSIDPIVGGTHYHFQIDTPSGSRQILTK